MANEIFDLTRKTRVYYDKGKGDPRTGTSTKLVEAPFVVVTLGNGQGSGLWPVDSPRVSLNNAKDYFFDTDSPSGIQGSVMPTSEFYFDGSTIIIGEHEMGDYNGQPENWKGLHKFSNI